MLAKMRVVASTKAGFHVNREWRTAARCLQYFWYFTLLAHARNAFEAAWSRNTRREFTTLKQEECRAHSARVKNSAGAEDAVAAVDAAAEAAERVARRWAVVAVLVAGAPHFPAEDRLPRPPEAVTDAALAAPS